MVIGVPRETHRHEHRVGLTPYAVGRLVHSGHTVLVEKEAGSEAHFSDHRYEQAGGQVVYSTEEVYLRSDLVCQVGQLSVRELELLRPESTVCAFHHLAVLPKDVVKRLMDLRLTLIGYEIVEDESGERPVLQPFSEMAGQMAVHLAAYYLQAETGGRGTLMGNVPGVPPPTILVLGAGTAGRSAARQALATGSHVIVFDADMRKLEGVHREFIGRLVTVVASGGRIGQYTPIADVVIGAILVPGARSPYLVTREMVEGMKPGSVIIDLSIDQGGCVETSRPTSLNDPTFSCHEVVHYCVPNMTANMPRTASRALSNVALPYLLGLATQGPEAALHEDAGLASGVYLYEGNMVNQRVGETLGVPITSLQDLLKAGGQR